MIGKGLLIVFIFTTNTIVALETRKEITEYLKLQIGLTLC